MNNDPVDIRACIIALLTGLEIQNIESFMSRLSEANCRLLGEAYASGAKAAILRGDTNE